ncbi:MULTISPECIES: hypothetical protein [Phocaeicola]|uniref:hypothetical protein n=1 Tax=Phocaeicola TaxID=909656 RepID=UPI0018AC0092|nr:hypothetical protein [Phocaeicola vulgatus]MDB0812241.1 hypothetical protein [Phocaeicola vulgatus]
MPASDNGFTTDWQLVAASGRDWLNSIFRNSLSGCRLYKEKPTSADSNQPAASWQYLAPMW